MTIVEMPETTIVEPDEQFYWQPESDDEIIEDYDDETGYHDMIRQMIRLSR